LENKEISRTFAGLVESSGSEDISGSTIPGDAKKAQAYAEKNGLDLTGKYIGMNGCGRMGK